MQKKSISISAIVLTLIMTFMEMTGLPAGLFLKLQVADINPIYFVLMLNFILAWLICWLWRSLVKKDWYFGLQREGLIDGLKKYGLPAFLATAATTIAFCIGLYPFNNTPTVARVVVEGFLYYIGVGIMEELYLRGLLQNILLKLFGDKRNAPIYAILIASCLFGAGHIFGALGQPFLVIIAKAVWASALGVYFGAIYYRTKNLWVPIILHTVIDFGGVPFCFATADEYPAIAIVTCLVSYIALAAYGLVILKKDE